MRIFFAVFFLSACAPTPQSSEAARATVQKDSSPAAPTPAETSSRSLRPSVRPTFVCGIFSDLVSGPLVVADLRLRSGNENRVPTDTDIERIQVTGGSVLHRFNVALVRARVDTASLRRLVSPSGIADYATLVTDANRFDASLQIFFSRPVTSRDLEALRNLKVQAAPIPFRPNILYAMADDRIIPTIQKMPGVNFVRARAMACEADF
jgi:hypothetical protein